MTKQKGWFGPYPYNQEYKFCSFCGREYISWVLTKDGGYDRKTGFKKLSLAADYIGCPKFKGYENLPQNSDHDYWYTPWVEVR